MADGFDQYVLQTATGEIRATLATSRRETLLDCLLRTEQPIRTQCRGSLICGGCRVQVVDGLEALPPPNPSEAALLERFAPGDPQARLACQIRLPEGVHELVVATPYW